MQIADVRLEFEAYAKASGVSLASLRPSEAIPVMLSFYRVVPCVGVDEPRGDALLYQWGIFNWGKGEHFELNITRQLILKGGDSDSDIFQLGLTLRFPPTDALRSISSGNRWCWNKADAGEFELSIYNSAPYRALEAISSVNSDLSFGEV